MEISPVTRKEHFLARAAGDEDALELQPVTREEHLLQNIIDAIEEGGGGGGSVTVDSEFSSTSTNPVQNRVITNAMTQATAALEAKMNKPTTIVYGDGAVSFEPLDNTIYQCGELTSLTVTNPPSTGSYAIVFTSGATATSTTFPATILGLEDFAAEANTLYEINVLDNRAVVGSWAVSA